MFRTVHSHPVIDMDKHFIIDPITREITNAESKKTILMQNDHNSERFSFEIDRVVEGHDLLACDKIEVHYTNVDTTKKNKSLGVYEVDDIEISTTDENKIVFTWLISQNATLHAGSLSFLIVFACVENGETTYRWNTGINTSISISKGMNNGDAIEENHPDVLSKWKNDLFAAMYGVETTHVGPTEPETYPYIWFDTSAYYGTSDQDIGVLTIKDADGNKSVLYPETKLAATELSNFTSEFETLKSDLNDKKNEIDDLFNNEKQVIRDQLEDTKQTILEESAEIVKNKQDKLVAFTVNTSDVSGWTFAYTDFYYKDLNVPDEYAGEYKGAIVTPAPDDIKTWQDYSMRVDDVENNKIRVVAKEPHNYSIDINVVMWR